MRIARYFFALFLCFTLLAEGQGNSFNKVRYQGGTATGVAVNQVKAPPEKNNSDAEPKEDEKPTTVKLTSNPEGADIYVDGSFVGNAPAQLKLSAGKHEIRVMRDGHQEWTRMIEILADSEISLNAVLKPVPK